MSFFWSLFDRGNNAPSASDNRLRSRILYGAGRIITRFNSDVTLGHNTRIHPEAKINSRSSKIFIGDNSLIAMGTAIQGNVTIGNNCSVQMYGNIVGYSGDKGKVVIGNDVRIAASCMIIAANHNFADLSMPISRQGLTFLPVIIEDDVWIGGRVNIMAGVTIGRGSVIGAGSVVTKDIPACSIAVGVPARVIKNRK